MSVSKSLIVGLTRSLQTMEEQGWIGAQNRDLMKKIMASLQKHSGDARFWMAKKGKDSLKSPVQKVKDRTGRPDVANLDLSMPGNIDVTDAKLSVMMQALLYQGILEQKKKSNRRGTLIRLDMARYGVREVNGFLPTDQKI